jgi:hypothetical protein
MICSKELVSTSIFTSFLTYRNVRLSTLILEPFPFNGTEHVCSTCDFVCWCVLSRVCAYGDLICMPKNQGVRTWEHEKFSAFTASERNWIKRLASAFSRPLVSSGWVSGIVSDVQSQGRTLRLTVTRAVCLGIKHPSGAYDQICITLRQLRVCWCGALSLTRGRVCRLQFLLALASAVILGSETHGTRNHTLLSQILDFSFRRLLRLAGLGWRYSTPPPHGIQMCW